VRIGMSTVAAAIVIASMSMAQAGDPVAATDKAETVCAGCHGPAGISTNPTWPNIAGQKEQYLIKALKEYRSGVRAEQTMSAMALALTDREIEDLAAYYAGL